MQFYKRLIFVFSALFVLINQSHAAEHCVVLQYHHVSEETPGITSVSPAQFQQHLDYLKDNKYNVLALPEVVSQLKQGKSLPDLCVALTIDDAYQSAYTEAWPRAQKYGFPLTIFVSTESVDLGLKSFLSWEQMREMSKNGVDFQNHSHSHDHLIRLHLNEKIDDWEQRIASEILMAQNRLTEELKISPTLFAYPYGEYNIALKNILSSMGLSAFGQQSGPIGRNSDFAALPRFPMNTLYASMRSFPTKISTLPLPIQQASPQEPLVDNQEWQPALKLTFQETVVSPQRLTCFFNGSPKINYQWDLQKPASVTITPKGKLSVGRNRYNCTLPSKEKGRFYWYSHNWIRKTVDGSWYKEP